MKGIINMRFVDVDDSHVNSEIDVKLEDVDFADKCIAFQALAQGLKMDRLELLMVVKSVISNMGGGEDES